jgi:hypothetical protein
MANRMMSASVVATVLSIALTTFPSIAQKEWELITPREEARDDSAPHVPGPPDLPAPPAIDLLRPDLSKLIRNPVTIEVRFSAGPGRPIDIRSFKATYGWLGINITGRLLEHAMTTPNGLSAENVDLPPGEHEVTLSIADTFGKNASRTFRFSVAQ